MDPEAITEGIPDLRIRPATADDAEVIAGMATAVERETRTGFPGISPEDVRRDGFGEKPAFHALLAESDGRAIGCALLTEAYDVGFGVRGLRLETLYVQRGWRGRAVASALIGAAGALAEERGATYLIWEVQKGQPALERYYRRLGAKLMNTAAYAIWGRPLQRLTRAARHATHRGRSG